MFLACFAESSPANQHNFHQSPWPISENFWLNPTMTYWSTICMGLYRGGGQWLGWAWACERPHGAPIVLPAPCYYEGNG